MNIEINSQQAKWLKEELEIMKTEYSTGKVPRSAFSKLVIVELLAKINENLCE